MLNSSAPSVLILVVMEEGQRQGPRPFLWDSRPPCLNPCCNGRGSKTGQGRPLCSHEGCLNPCCNGRGSKTELDDVEEVDAES